MSFIQLVTNNPELSGGFLIALILLSIGVLRIKDRSYSKSKIVGLYGLYLVGYIATFNIYFSYAFEGVKPVMVEVEEEIDLNLLAIKESKKIEKKTEEKIQAEEKKELVNPFAVAKDEKNLKITKEELEKPENTLIKEEPIFAPAPIIVEDKQLVKPKVAEKPPIAKPVKKAEKEIIKPTVSKSAEGEKPKKVKNRIILKIKTKREKEKKEEIKFKLL